MNLENHTHLLALAARMEGEGQYNIAKLLRAASASELTRSAYRLDLPARKDALLDETARAIETLKEQNADPGLVQALERGRSAMAGGRLPGYDETPDPFACRTCGHLSLGEAPTCPECGAQPATFQRYRSVYWLEAFDPITALEHLRATPQKVAAILEASGNSHTGHAPEAGSWSLPQALSHLRDAQGVLAARIDLVLEQENPLLEAKAVFEWAASEGDQASARQLFETYRASRQQTVARLESLPLSDWWRPGRHEEFGQLRLYHQASYFACHELTHLPQIERLAA
jgi:hypothetical protein